MTETASCESCGMPIETGRDRAHCVGENGQLQSFEERFEDGLPAAAPEPEATRAQLEAKTKAYMATMPAWRDHRRSTPRVSTSGAGRPRRAGWPRGRTWLLPRCRR